MRPTPSYHAEPYRRTLDVQPRVVSHEGASSVALLDDTILYPGGGGQPEDRGWLAGRPVVAVAMTAEGYGHRVEGDIPDGPLELRVDWPRRFDHMQQHTAQHLLSAVAADAFGWRTTAFHLGEDRSDVELDVDALSDAQLADIEEAAMEHVRAARPVGTRTVSLEEYRELSVRSRGLPDAHEGDVRLVEIDGVDLATCGGTHLRSTAEIESLKLLSTESTRGATRLHWVAGGRVRARLAAHEERTAELRAVLKVADAELVPALHHRLERLQDAQRELGRARAAWAEATAERLAGRGEPLVEAHFDDLDAGTLRAVAQAFSREQGSALALLTATSDDSAYFTVVAGASGPIDVGALGSAVASALGGRGGGSGRVFQGKADRLDGRAAALDALRAGATP